MSSSQSILVDESDVDEVPLKINICSTEKLFAALYSFIYNFQANNVLEAKASWNSWIGQASLMYIMHPVCGQFGPWRKHYRLQIKATFTALHTKLINGLNVVVFLPGTTDGERQVLNRIAQELAYKNHGVCTFKGIIIPEVKYIVMQRLHLVRELKLNLGLSKEIYEPMKTAGNKGIWSPDYDTKEYILPFWKGYANACEPILNSDLMDRLRDEVYDVAIVYAGNPCYLGIVHALSIPFIYFDTTGFSDEIVMASGMPSLPGLIPSSESTHNQEMNIVERADNLWCQAKEYVPYTNVSCLMKTFSDRWVHIDEPISKLFQNESHLKERFPYFPNVNEIKQKAALYFVSSDPIIEFAGRPAWSNVIYVGGMHMENARPLFPPYNTTNAMRKGGVIVMSFGNLVNGSAMPSYIHEAFLDAFRKLPDIQVYWRIGSVRLPDMEPEDIPPNVNLTQFVPQNDLLADDSARLLISHGGISSIMEAVYYGVPILGIPLYGPNYNNLRKIEAKGAAIILEKNKITKESVYRSIKELLNNQKYRNTAKQMSRVFKDRPMTPFETAIYWVEFIGRHHGAPYLDPVIPKNMPLYQHLLLDVAAILLTSLYIVVKIMRWCCRKMCNCCSKNTTDMERQPRAVDTKQSANSKSKKIPYDEKQETSKKLKKKPTKSD